MGQLVLPVQSQATSQPEKQVLYPDAVPNISSHVSGLLLAWEFLDFVLAR